MEAFSCVTYKYALHECGGMYQWRWFDPLPPECNGDPAIGPVFDSLHHAKEWGAMYFPYRHKLTELKWKPIEP